MTKCQPGMPTGILGPLFSYALTIYTMSPFHSSPVFFIWERQYLQTGPLGMHIKLQQTQTAVLMFNTNSPTPPLRLVYTLRAMSGKSLVGWKYRIEIEGWKFSMLPFHIGGLKPVSFFAAYCTLLFTSKAWFTVGPSYALFCYFMTYWNP